MGIDIYGKSPSPTGPENLRVKKYDPVVRLSVEKTLQAALLIFQNSQVEQRSGELGVILIWVA